MQLLVERLRFPILVVQTNDISLKFYTSLLFFARYLTMKYWKNTVYIRIGIETKCFRVYHVKVRLHAYQDTISDKILLLFVCIFRMITKVVR